MEHSTPNKLPKLNYKDRSIDIVCPSSEKMTLSRDALQKKGRRLINLLFLGVTRQAAGLLVGWTEQRPRPVEQDADNENDVKTGKLRETDNNNTNSCRVTIMSRLCVEEEETIIELSFVRNISLQIEWTIS